MKTLPLGIQDFKGLRTEDLLYVDKTEHLFGLIRTGGYYFLARPRRFGKSLMLATIKEIFKGSKALFKDLWIEDKWNWEKTNPVLHFHFNRLGHKDIGLKKALLAELQVKAEEQGVTLSEKGLARRFGELLKKVAQKGKVVLLIDEYDKPLIDYLGKKQRHQALENQGILKNFYSAIKNNDENIRFLFITGVTKFSKTGVFSELNNLDDITTDWDFAALVGYTQEEIERYFKPYRPKAMKRNQLTDKELSIELKSWYNGYSWDGETYVYNPWPILSFFKKGVFSNYWFSTGTPTFLINILKERFFYDFENHRTGITTFESYDLDNLDTLPLLLQTGYLTIKKRTRNVFELGYPNREVKDSMMQHLIGAFRHEESAKSALFAYSLQDAFENNQLEEVIVLINSMFASIPYQIFEAKKEKYYHSLIHLLFTYLGIFIKSEVNTNKGRMDALVETDTHIYVLEFKLDKKVQEAIEQIKKRGYAEQFAKFNKEIVAVGINFSSKTKNVEDWDFKVL